MKNPLKSPIIFCTFSGVWGSSIAIDVVNNGSKLSIHFLINTIFSGMLGWWATHFIWEN